MKKLVVLLLSILMVVGFSTIASAQTLPVKDIVYYESYGDIYVLLENGSLSFGDAIDTANPIIVSSDVKEIISYYDFLIILHNDGKIDKLNYFAYEGNKIKVKNTIEYTIDVNATKVIKSKSDFLFLDKYNNLYKYNDYRKEAHQIFKNVRKCAKNDNSYNAYVLTTTNDLYFIDYYNTENVESELVLSNVSEFFVKEDECYALKKSGEVYYKYVITTNTSGEPMTPERGNIYYSLKHFVAEMEYDIGVSNNKYMFDSIKPFINSDEKIYIDNKNFYYVNGVFYKANGQRTYKKYFENIKMLYVYKGGNFNNVYMLVSQDGRLFVGMGKVNRVHGTDTLDVPYLTSFCEKGTKVIINNKEVKLETKIQISNNRSMYPFRECLENMGALVMWDSTNRIAIGELNGITVEFPIDKNYYYINGEKHYMDTMSYISNGRTYIPIRFAAEAFGFTVQWESTLVENKISIFQ